MWAWSETCILWTTDIRAYNAEARKKDWSRPTRTSYPSPPEPKACPSLWCLGRPSGSTWFDPVVQSS